MATYQCSRTRASPLDAVPYPYTREMTFTRYMLKGKVDAVYANEAIQGCEELTKNNKERLITTTKNCNKNNTRINGKSGIIQLKKQK